MYVIGLNSGIIGHDAAACLIKDGEIVAAVEEERFNREKHSGKFPIKAIEFCCKQAGISPKDVDIWAYYWDRDKLMKRYWNVLPHLSLGDGLNYIASMRLFWSKTFIKSLRQQFKENLDVSPDRILFVPHHLTHAASCFYLSGFKESAILTVDGFGEYESSLLMHGSGLEMKTLKAIALPTSIGVMYSCMTSFMGFRANSGEYKVMGLSPYGTPKYYEALKQFVRFNDDGTYEIDPRFYTKMNYRDFYNDGKFPEFIVKALGKPRKPESVITQREKDLAASLQKITEECILHSARYLKQVTKSKRLCMAGGVALNSVANTKIKKELGFEEIFIQPAASDSGCSLGAACYAYVNATGKGMKPMTHAYLGPSYSNEEVEESLKRYELKYTREDDICRSAAKLIADGKIIGWFQGRMEYGPRALGCRSILADPRNPAMKDKLNEAVKLREGFRPFAPSLNEEHQEEYLEMYGLKNSPYMLFVLPVNDQKQSMLPAITHVDGTARPQTVSKQTNEIYWRLIEEFRKQTGEAIIVNTSYNVRGEPIVCTPEDAIRCYLDTDIDVLVLHDFLITEKNLAKKVEYARKLTD
jgi:carbamoyltransferase